MMCSLRRRDHCLILVVPGMWRHRLLRGHPAPDVHERIVVDAHLQAGVPLGGVDGEPGLAAGIHDRVDCLQRANQAVAEANVLLGCLDPSHPAGPPADIAHEAAIGGVGELARTIAAPAGAERVGIFSLLRRSLDVHPGTVAGRSATTDRGLASAGERRQFREVQ